MVGFTCMFKAAHYNEGLQVFIAELYSLATAHSQTHWGPLQAISLQSRPSLAFSYPTGTVGVESRVTVFLGPLIHGTSVFRVSYKLYMSVC